MSDPFSAEVAVIGGGPAGLVAAIALATAGVDTLHELRRRGGGLGAAALCVIISMTLQVPELSVTAYMPFFISQETKLKTIIVGAIGLIGLTIGIGASPVCDGQVLVLEDMLGLSPWAPKFVKRYTSLGPAIEAAVSTYAKEVRNRTFPGPENVYAVKKKG